MFSWLYLKMMQADVGDGSGSPRRRFYRGAACWGWGRDFLKSVYYFLFCLGIVSFSHVHILVARIQVIYKT